MTILLVRLLGARAKVHGALLMGAAVLCIVIGGVIFALTQHLPVTTGWYWAITTATTVGYGDVTPKNGAGRVIASVVMLTTIPLLAAAFAVLTGATVAKHIRRFLDMEIEFPEGTYRLILGMHPAIPIVLEELDDAGDSVVLIADVDPSIVPKHVHFIRGDPSSETVLKTGRPQGARHILIASDDDGDALMIAVLVRQEAPGVPVMALVGSGRLSTAMHDLGVGQVLSPEDLAGHTIAKGLEAPHAGELLMNLVQSEAHQLVERVVADGPARPLSELRAEAKGLILGVVHQGSVSLGVAEDPLVEAGDVILLVEASPP